MSTGVLRQRFSVVDTIWEIETDSAAIVECARRSFPNHFTEEESQTDFAIRIVVDTRLAGCVDTTPIFRGRDHLVFADYGRAGFFALDLNRRTGYGAVSPELAGNPNYWRESIFPVIVGLACLVLDAVPLHAACIEYGGRGVLIAGRSGMGKSTLAATFAKQRVPYISDDWVYLSGRTGRVHAAPVNMKLLPEAVAQFFPELSNLRETLAMNGETSVSFDPSAAFNVPRRFSCFPEVVILLQRQPATETRVRKASIADLVAFFSEPLDCVPDCLQHVRARQIEIIKTLSTSDCYVLTCSGMPDDIASTVLQVCHRNVCVGPAEPATFPAYAPLDLLRRHASTPHNYKAVFGDRVISIDCDSSDPLRLLPPANLGSEPAMRLDLLTESQAAHRARTPITFSHGNLIGCSFGGGECALLEGATGFAFVSPETIASGAFTTCLSRLLEERCLKTKITAQRTTSAAVGATP